MIAACMCIGSSNQGRVFHWFHLLACSSWHPAVVHNSFYYRVQQVPGYLPGNLKRCSLACSVGVLRCATIIPRPIQLPLARKLSPANQHTQCPMGPASHARSLATPPLPDFASAPGVLLGCVLHSAGAVCGKGSARTRPTLTQKRDSPTNCRPYRPAARGTGGAVWEGTINWWRLWSQRVIVATGRHPGAAAAKTLRCRQTGGREYIQSLR
ncbi:hypothetical protein K466DRAFT_21176 [Polyporus arcularius HHB13444]|uniref:Uncharacterized protein n=1 Tax=Polyporus arcularius HHB13444 TaxID=1314778 RepID=A0A5C3PZ16_9APHY|nr:hypothetical protein K466DRAFT_21176 [Polyporus arcularius HHB13444]